MLWHDMEQRLAQEPFTWTLWWEAGKRWLIDLSISPYLSPEQPLWSRDEKSLKSLRLFRLSPEALQAELEAYWKKPFWQRWFLALFSRIHNKREVWSYYRRCLSFREVKKRYPVGVLAFQGSEKEQAIFSQLGTWWSQRTRQFERILEKHAGDLNWQRNSFAAVLHQYEKKTEREFFKLMNKKLKKLATESQRNSLGRRIREGYQELAQAMHDYLAGSLPSSSEQASAKLESAELNVAAPASSQELVYLGPTATVTMQPMGAIDTDLADMKSVRTWVNLKQQAIADLLAAEIPEGPYAEIKKLLEQSLYSISRLVALELEQYQQKIDELVRQGVAANYEEAISQINPFKLRQLGLIKFFRSGFLLFHPDKSNADEDLIIIKTELFKQFKQLSDAAMETLGKGLQRLEGRSAEWKYQKILVDLRRHEEEFRLHVEAELEKIARAAADSEARRAQKQAEFKAEMEAEIEAKVKAAIEEKMKAEIEAKIKVEMKAFKQSILAQNRRVNPCSESPQSVEETPATSTHFLVRR
ncbi:MAG: hypothetical protein RLZZ225_1192 [Pseudomonadota bacterium]|jgi:hypothetical protein